MIKKIFLTFLFSSLFSPVYAIMETFSHKENGEIEATSKGITFRSAPKEDMEAYQATLAGLSFKEGYPSEEGAGGRFEAQNLNRQEIGNAYHCYRWLSSGQPLGFVQFGRMPTTGYTEGIEGAETAHHPIIKKWMDLGITGLNDPEGSLNKDNILRQENRGLGIIVPLFEEGIEEGIKINAFNAAYDLMEEFRTRGFLLPLEDTRPHGVIILCHPDDPALPLWETAGFTLDDNPGFGWFYPKEGRPNPRVMGTRFF